MDFGDFIGGAYFVNRHNTFWKELNFNFPEHQKILKSIKNPSQKMKKSEKFSKNQDFFGKSRFSEIFEKIMKFSDFFQIFSFFEMDFLWISKNFDVLERGDAALYNKYYVYL